MDSIDTPHKAPSARRHIEGLTPCVITMAIKIAQRRRLGTKDDLQSSEWYLSPRMEVVCSSALAFDLRAFFGASARVVVPDVGVFSRDEVLAALPTADALIATLDLQIDDELLAAGPNLRVVANHAVGVDNVDIQAANGRGVVVANTPGVLTEATADFAWALLLAAARRVVEGHQLARSGAWRGWHPNLLLGAEVYGQTLGIVGLGRIGRAVARRAQGFSMRTLYTGPRRVGEDSEVGATYVDLPTLLRESNFLSLHCPATPQTSPVLTSELLLQMRPGSILINTARGTCVDEDGLVRALDQGVVAAAGLDVFAREPTIPESLAEHPQVVLAPHLGSATTAARRAMGRLCAQAVADVWAGRTPAHAVNIERVS